MAKTTEMTVFEFGDKKIRTAGTATEPLFCAADVCAVLGIENPSDAVKRLREAERTTLASTESLRKSGKNGNLSPGAKSLIYVTEAGLYKLIFSSRKSEAERFQDWVTQEVLPSIRRKGYYSLIDDCFRELPEKQATLFAPLIGELKRFAKPSDGGYGGTPPWARMVAGWVYDWTWKEHKSELRERNPIQEDGSLVWGDYDFLTEEGRRLVSITIGMSVFAARDSGSWQEWREKMEAYFCGQPKLPFRPQPKRLTGKR